MFITCEKCKTKYRFDESQVEGDGAWVRCSRCKNVFFQKKPSAEVPVADEIMDDSQVRERWAAEMGIDDLKKAFQEIEDDEGQSVEAEKETISFMGEGAVEEEEPEDTYIHPEVSISEPEAEKPFFEGGSVVEDENRKDFGAPSAAVSDDADEPEEDLSPVHKSVDDDRYSEGIGVSSEEDGETDEPEEETPVFAETANIQEGQDNTDIVQGKDESSEEEEIGEEDRPSGVPEEKTESPDQDEEEDENRPPEPGTEKDFSHDEEDEDDEDDWDDEDDLDKKSKKYFIGLIVFTIIFVLVVTGGVYMWFFPDSAKSAKEKIYPMIGLDRFLGVGENLKGKDVVAPDIVFTEVKERFAENWVEGNMLVIEGIAINNNSYPVSDIRVAGRALDSSGRTLAEEKSCCGNILTEEELLNSTGEEIRKELSKPYGGDDFSNKNVAASGRVPFMIVFINPGGDVGGFNIELAGLEVANDN